MGKLRNARDEDETYILLTGLNNFIESTQDSFYCNEVRVGKVVQYRGIVFINKNNNPLFFAQLLNKLAKGDIWCALFNKGKIKVFRLLANEFIELFFNAFRIVT